MFQNTRFHAFIPDTMEQSMIPRNPNVTVQHVLHVQSSKVPNGNHSEYKVYLKTPITDIVRVELVSADIPVVVPNITSINHTFTFEENGITLTLKVPVGTYSETELCIELQRLMNLKSKVGGGYIISYLRYRGKIRIFPSNQNVTSLRVVESPIASLLGFTKEQSLASKFDSGNVDPSDNFYENCLISDSFINLNSESCIYLSIQELNRGYTDLSYDGRNVEGLTHFGKIYTNVPVGTFKSFNTDDDAPVFSEYTGNPLKRLDTLTIKWYDSKFQVLPFQGIPHTMTLVFTCMDSRIKSQ